MSPAEFKAKWERYRGKETAGYVEHFNDLCKMLGQRTPAEADPSGTEWFCFQKHVTKDLEVKGWLPKNTGDERGFADVWRKNCFAFEYKGKRKDLAEAHKQLLRYRESLENPPLLCTCDFDRFVVRTNFNGTVSVTYEFTNDEIDKPENIRVLRALFENPDSLRPLQTTAKVTEELAEAIGEVARSLQEREAVELADARNRREVNVALRKNLRIARFLNRIVFCLFAEDTGLLPSELVHDVLKKSAESPDYFAPALESLFRAMSKGGLYGPHQIRHFNGHLFEDTTVFELLPEEIRKLAIASESSWHSIQPSIMGTLFERALEPEQRSQLGAHYTSEEDIKTLVEPVLMSPLRREWHSILHSEEMKLKTRTGILKQRVTLREFQNKLANVTVLDPACGSGNFLYVALRSLLDLEKEVLTTAAKLGLSFTPKVDVTQLRAIEINPYAYELAQVSVQIGALQWRRENGFDNERSPVLRTLQGFENKDALLRETFKKQPKNLKAAREEEHAQQTEMFRIFHERAWPEATVILGNPPFLGDKVMRGELGDEYVDELRAIFDGRLPGQADFCCYWFEKARAQIELKKTERVGLVATQNIRGGASRAVLDRIKASGDIFFAISDRNWVLSGAMVHIAMVGFDVGLEKERVLDGVSVDRINSNLSAGADITKAVRLQSNSNVGFLGSCKGGPFDISEDEARELLMAAGNPNGNPNSDLVRPVCNSEDLTQGAPRRWIIDTANLTLPLAAMYEKPFRIIEERVKPVRTINRDKWLRENWWRPQRMRAEMRAAIEPLSRFLVTPTTSKHRIWSWLAHPTIPDHKLIVFGRDDDLFFGVACSRFHELWAREIGTQLRERESGLNYNVQSSFETFPFPPGVLDRGESLPSSVQNAIARIEVAAKDLHEARCRWLTPKEWIRRDVLTFPASVDGIWRHFIDRSTVVDKVGVASYGVLSPATPSAAEHLKARTLTELYNQKPSWLAELHAQLDDAVAAAYGFRDTPSDKQVIAALIELNNGVATREAGIRLSTASKDAPAKIPRQRNKSADELV